jgi:hypothetical protein
VAATINAAASAVGLQVNPNATGSAEVARFYHTNGSTYSGFDNAARFFVRTSGITHGSPAFAVNTASDTGIGAVIRANSATQSANLQEWQDSSGNILSRVGNDGRTRIGGSNGIGTGITAATLGVGGIDAAWTVIVAKAAASQTADLQQWQTSAAAVGTRVVAGGGIIAVEPIITSTAGAGTTTTLDCSTGTTFTVTFGAGNVTGFLFTNLPAAGSTTITLILKQDGTGSRTVTWSGTQVNGSATNATPKWAGGTAPTLTTTANAVDIVTLVINRTGGSTDNVYGFLAGKAFA